MPARRARGDDALEPSDSGCESLSLRGLRQPARGGECRPPMIMPCQPKSLIQAEPNCSRWKGVRRYIADLPDTPGRELWHRSATGVYRPGGALAAAGSVV